MVAPYRRALTNSTDAADALLALMEIHAPTQRQHIGAHLLGEALVRLINYLPPVKTE
jgi:hypothetical protein